MHTGFPSIMHFIVSRVPRATHVTVPRHPGGYKVHYSGEYVFLTDGWCQTWLVVPVGMSSQSFMSNLTPTHCDTGTPATFDKYEKIPHIFQNDKMAVPLSVEPTFVRNDCKNTPTGASDHL